MSLAPGTRVGPYEITGQIGAGGMGEVYRATDANLGRQVAIKVLPDALAQDRERVARFEREARTLATLNHRNIAIVHGFEKSDGLRALVMELVEGPTIADRIAQGPIPLDEALPIAKQIAEALEAAHEHGIVHRDLKPANIKLRPDGTVKVLDFGLAKALASEPGSTVAGDLSQSPTITSPAMISGVGMILGTAAYMAPEQAKGRAADKRSDVWAFGAVLYEMLSGVRAFQGDDVSETLAAVLRSEPTWTALPVSTPPPIRRLLRRCLEKDRKRRLDSAAAARLEIEDSLTAPSAVEGAAVSAGLPPRRPVIAASLGVLVGAAAAALATWVATQPAPRTAPDLIRFTITPTEGQTLSVDRPDHHVAIAPDGRHLVYQEGNIVAARFVVRAIDQLESVPLRGFADIRWPFISPDSHWIGFFGQGELRKVSMAGGPSVSVCRIQGVLTGASWGPDNTIVFATSHPSTGLLSVPAGGGEPKALTTPDPAQNERDHAFPSVLPDGRAVLFTILSGPIEDAQVAVLDLQTGRTKTLFRGGSQAEYVETGHLIYASGSTLLAVRFDPRRLEVLGESVPVVEGVRINPNGNAVLFSVSRHGTLAYVRGGVGGTQRTLVWVDRKGREEPIQAAEPRAYTYARLAPDGTRIALDIRDQQNDIWIWDLARQNLQRLTSDPGFNRLPVWTPDSQRVAFTAERDGVESMYWQAADGSGTAERLSSGTNQGPQSFSPDGTQLIFSTPLSYPRDLGILSLGASGPAEMLLHTPADENNAQISPNGRWLAYDSNESSQTEVFVRPFPNVKEKGRQMISKGGGTRPLWSRTGRELFYYVAPGTIMAVSVPLGTLDWGPPQVVVKGPYPPTAFGRHYDVSADGQRFLLLKEAPPPDGEKPVAPQINVIVNWQEELKRLVPTK